MISWYKWTLSRALPHPHYTRGGVRVYISTTLHNFSVNKNAEILHMKHGFICQSKMPRSITFMPAPPLQRMVTYRQVDETNR